MPWPTTSIGELFDIGAGKSVTPASRGQEPKRPFLRTSNVLWGRFDLTDVDTMFFTDAEFATKNLRSGDLLVCEGGDIGRAAVWQGQLDECSFQNHLHRLRPKRPDISPEFYQFALEGGITLFGLIEGVGNRTTIPNLSRNRLAELAVPLPPFDEQRKIAAVLGKVQAAVAVEGDLVRVARELKQAALRQLFTRGLRHEPQKQTALGPVPESWIEVRVDALGEVVTGTTPKTAERDNYEGGTFDFISPGDISIHGQEIRRAAKKITEAGMKKSRVLPKGTSCFVCIGSTIGKLGITTQERSATNQQINAVIPGTGFDPHFVFYTLLWNAERIASRASPSPVPIMSKSLFSEPLVWVTRDPGEQRAIAALLATLDAKIAHHEARQARLRELFRTLLHDLLTARRRVTSLNLDHFADVSKMIAASAP